MGVSNQVLLIRRRQVRHHRAAWGKRLLKRWNGQFHAKLRPEENEPVHTQRKLHLRPNKITPSSQKNSKKATKISPKTIKISPKTTDKKQNRTEIMYEYNRNMLSDKCKQKQAKTCKSLFFGNEIVSECLTT